jgi:hypothetical protein
MGLLSPAYMCLKHGSVFRKTLQVFGKGALRKVLDLRRVKWVDNLEYFTAKDF